MTSLQPLSSVPSSSSSSSSTTESKGTLSLLPYSLLTFPIEQALQKALDSLEARYQELKSRHQRLLDVLIHSFSL